MLSRGGNVYARVFLRAGVNDLTGGFKAWRAELLSELLDESTASDGYGFQIEMTLRAARHGARIREVPIIVPRAASRYVEDELADRVRGRVAGAVDGSALSRPQP